MQANVAPIPIKVEECKEYDGENRDCAIMLYTRPVDVGFVNGVLKPGSQLQSTLDEAILGDNTRVHLDHWILVAYFKDGDRLFSFEASDNESGVIEVYRTAGALAEKEGYKIELTMINTSPKDLLELAQKHSYNGTQYSAVFKNCQDWVKEFARMISYEVYDCLKKIKTFQEAGGIIRAAVSVPTGLAINSAKKSAECLEGGIKSSSACLKSLTYCRYCEFAVDSFCKSSGHIAKLSANSLKSSFSCTWSS